MNEYKTYLDTRPLHSGVVEDFNLGFCDDLGTKKFLRGPFVTDEVYTDLENFYLDSRFKNSMLFPIFDMYGSLLGISAKLLGSDRQAKYLNTVYSKGEHLYGFNVTKRYCFKANKVYVVEGNFDVVSMYNYGIKNVVGMLGSSLTSKQLVLLSRMVDDVVFVPDGDKAGRTFLDRMFRSNDGSIPLTKKYSSLGLKFKVVGLPETEDPDSFLRRFGKDKLLKLEKEYEPSIQFMFNNLLGGKA